MIQALAFYFFAGILLTSSALVISVRNPVHSVLFLIVAFFNAASLFFMIGAEYVAFILIIVYVGALAVLFLFVVMMLDVDFSAFRKEVIRYAPLGLLIGGVLLAEICMLYFSWADRGHIFVASAVEPAAGDNNTEAIGKVLYTDFAFPFQIAGVILLAAMVGVIVLAHRVRPGIKRQNPSEQVSIKREDVIEIKKVTPGTGV